MARSWHEIRAEAIAHGRVDPASADAARKDMHDAVQAQRLAEIRKAHGLAPSVRNWRGHVVCMDDSERVLALEEAVPVTTACWYLVS